MNLPVQMNMTSAMAQLHLTVELGQLSFGMWQIHLMGLVQPITGECHKTKRRKGEQEGDIVK